MAPTSNSVVTGMRLIGGDNFDESTNSHAGTRKH
jgi:hypothetical protein